MTKRQTPFKPQRAAFRLPEDLQAKLRGAAERRGVKLSREIRERLERSFDAEIEAGRRGEFLLQLDKRMASAGLQLDDLVDFVRFAEFVQRNIREVGEDAAQWRDYAPHARFPSVLLSVGAAERDGARVRRSVERAYQTSRAFLATNGPALADDMYRRREVGRGGGDRDSYYAEAVLHKEHARRVDRIEAGRGWHRAHARIDASVPQPAGDAAEPPARCVLCGADATTRIAGKDYCDRHQREIPRLASPRKGR